MKKNLILLILLFYMSFSVSVTAQVTESDFKNPPMSVRPNTYWEWMNGNINRAGLIADLDYMKRAGYGAAMIFEAGVGIPKGSVDYNSAEWADCIELAVKEAGQRGIEMFMHNSPGYSGTGGKWITPEYSMKQLVWSDTCVSAGEFSRNRVRMRLSCPFAKMGYYRDAFVLAYPCRERKIPVAANFHQLFDHDIKTQLRIKKDSALTIELRETAPVGSVTLFRGDREKPQDPHDGPRDYPPVLTFEVSADGITFHKAGVMRCGALRAMDVPGFVSFARQETRYIRITSNRDTNIAEMSISSEPRLVDGGKNIGSADAINPDDVIDISRYMSADGQLDWKAPAGSWNIVRIGYTTTGEVVAAAPDAGVGLEIDKFSKKAMDRHFELFLTPLLNRLRPWCGTTLKGLVVDSWEAGKQNWTDSIPQYFKKKRGYDICPYVLAATGRVVGSVDDTKRFLRDFSRTHADMLMENYVDYMKGRLKPYGLKYVGEAYGDGNFESTEFAMRQDYPMSEFWTHYIYGNIQTTILASSAAHLWGQNVVQCECYTGTPFNSKFTEHPYGMKALADYIFSAGVNRFVYHCTAHQPYTGGQPGNIMTMGPFGTHLDRNSTWVGQFRGFNEYVSRCSYMLQQGKYVADMLYIKGEDLSSGVTNYNISAPIVPFGYRWDITGVEGLRRLHAEDGCIVSPSGMHYRMIVVPKDQRISADTEAVLASLEAQGVKIVRDNNVSGTLKAMGIKPDFAFVARNKDAQVHFIHRSTDGEEVYFVANHRRRSEDLTLSFRVNGKVPTLWNAETGETNIPVAYSIENGTTKINLTLQESGSVFIVFRNGQIQPSVITDICPKPTVVTAKTGTIEFNPDKSMNGTFTLSLWAKPETFAAGGRGFLLFPQAQADGRAQVGLSMGQNGMRVYERGRRMNMVLEVLRPISGWTHVVLVYKGGTPYLYINGDLAAIGKKSASDCIPAIDVPMAEEQFMASFEGDQTATTVYDYALSAEEIRQLGTVSPFMSHHKSLDDGWEVRFPAWSKAPSSVVLPRLASLHKHDDFNVRHFSGTAVYVKHIKLSGKELRGKKAILDLGRVENIAEVTVNGNDTVMLWKAPYRADITRWLHKGDNTIEVSVTNLYPNRIIGDEYLPEKYEYDEYGRIRQLPQWYLDNGIEERERVLFLPWKYYTKDSPLLEAGLLGPVSLKFEKNKE